MDKLIVLTGLDGSGTSSVASELQKLDAKSSLFNGIDHSYSDSREKIDKEVRNTSPSAHYFFYLSANIYTSFLIERALKKGNAYCVRYLIDTVVSHRVAGLPVELVYETDFYTIRKPDLIIFLSVKEKLRQKRLERRGRSYLDATLDKKSFRKKFLDEFSRFSDQFTTVDVSNKNVSEVAVEVREIMKNLGIIS